MNKSDERRRADDLDRALAPTIQRLSDASTALCHVRGLQRPIPGGSAVLLHVASRNYLVTASHVFEGAIEGRTLAAVLGGSFISLAPSRRWRTKRGSGDTEDRTDLAIVELELEPELQSRLTFLGLEDIDPFGPLEERALTTAFLAIGFPRSKQARSLDGNTYSAELHSFVTHREKIWRDNSIGADSVRHIAIGYDPRGFAGGEQFSQMPKPDGCSGGGLWRISEAQTSDNGQAKLVGIMIEHHSKPHNIILASRVWNLLGGFRGIDLATREAIDTAFPEIEGRAREFSEL